MDDFKRCQEVKTCVVRFSKNKNLDKDFYIICSSSEKLKIIYAAFNFTL